MTTIVYLTARLILTFFRFETQHGLLCALGYVAADCMKRTHIVSVTFGTAFGNLLFYVCYQYAMKGMVY